MNNEILQAIDRSTHELARAFMEMIDELRQGIGLEEPETVMTKIRYKPVWSCKKYTQLFYRKPIAVARSNL